MLEILQTTLFWCTPGPFMPIIFPNTNDNRKDVNSLMEEYIKIDYPK